MGSTKRKKSSGGTKGGGGSSSTSDFKRIKAKVGKRAIKINETDVSFKAASIHVTDQQQSLLDDTNSGNAATSNRKDENDDGDDGTTLHLVSSRGKTIDELLVQLGHPASTVRVSALRGIQDIIKHIRNPHKQLRPYLSILIPSCIHTCVDEDDDVRKVGIDLIVSILSSSSSSSSSSSQDANHIQPFSTLIMARTNSALHSLDASTRIDGVRLIHQISSKFPSIVFSSSSSSSLSSSSSTTTSIYQILPSFVHLLSDPKTKKAIDDILMALVSLLRAATTTATAISTTTTGTSTASTVVSHSIDDPDLVYKSGGRSKNSVILPGRRYHQHHQHHQRQQQEQHPSTTNEYYKAQARRCIRSLSQLPKIVESNGLDNNDDDHNSQPSSSSSSQYNTNKNNKKTNSSSSSSSSWSKIHSNLFEKLRDVYLEALMVENSNDSTGITPTIGAGSQRKGKKTSSHQNMHHLMERRIVVLRAVRLLYTLYISDLERTEEYSNNPSEEVSSSSSSSSSSSNHTLIETTTHHILSLSIESFPVVGDDNNIDDVGDDDIDDDKKSGSGSTSSGQMINDEMNAAIVATILDVALNGNGSDSCTGPLSQDKKRQHEDWLKAVVMYVIPRIGLIATQPNKPTPDLETTCKLIRHLGLRRKKNTLFKTALLKLIQSIKESFFNTQDVTLARSIVGRKMFLLMMELADDDMNIPSSISSSSSSSASRKSDILSSIVEMAPFCLGMWESKYLYESHIVLYRLESIVKRTEVAATNCHLISELRQQFSWLVKPIVNLPRASTGSTTTSQTRSVAVLELYPTSLQRRVLGIMILLQSPTDECLNGLMSICCHNWVNVNQVLTEGVVDAVHSVRTTVSMRQYLTFVIGSIGISYQIKHIVQRLKESGLSETAFDETFFPIDSALKNTSVHLVHCGPTRILPMILPQLITWMRSSEKKSNDHQSLSELIKMRSSIVILAFLSLAIQTLAHSKPDMSILNIASDQLHLKNLTDFLCNFVHACVSCDDVGHVQSKIVSPMVGLMASNETILTSVFQRLCDWFRTTNLRKTEQMNVVRLMQEWVSDARLRSVIKMNQKVLLDSVKGFDTSEKSDDDITSNIKQLVAALEIFHL